MYNPIKTKTKMQITIQERDPQSVLLDAILTNAFNALANYTGWPITHINEILERYTPADNIDYLGDLISDFLNGNPTSENVNLDFYLNSDDLLLQDAMLSQDSNFETSDENITWYRKEDEELLQTFYTDPILGITFNILID